jgi:hypothetical protein
MSEAHAAPQAPEAADTGSDEAAFEAARLAEVGDEAGEGEEGGDEGEKPAVDWQKRAMDKEGQAAKERARRREAERRARELETRLERLETRDKPATQAEEDDLVAAINALRDDDEDPITDLASVKRALKAFMRQQSEETQAEAVRRVQQEAVVKIARAMDEAEADFADEHPDYREAVEHFKKARREDYEDMGFSGEALEAELVKDFLGLVQRAMSGGRDPAEVVYNLAKKRGFQSGKAAAEAKLKEIVRAAEASKGPTSGKNGEGRMTVDQINRLKGAAYESAWAKLREQERRAG